MCVWLIQKINLHLLNHADKLLLKISLLCFLHSTISNLEWLRIHALHYLPICICWSDDRNNFATRLIPLIPKRTQVKFVTTGISIKAYYCCEKNTVGTNYIKTNTATYLFCLILLLAENHILEHFNKKENILPVWLFGKKDALCLCNALWLLRNL